MLIWRTDSHSGPRAKNERKDIVRESPPGTKQASPSMEALPSFCHSTEPHPQLLGHNPSRRTQRCWILAARRGKGFHLCLQTSGFQWHLELFSPLNMLCCATPGRSLALSGHFEAYPRSSWAIIKQQILESDNLGLSSDSAKWPWVTLSEWSKFYESLVFLL